MIVGVNTDRSVRALKGKERPIVAENDRAQVLAGLASVDAVILFDDDTPLRLIAAIRPEILVKGSDYSETEVVGADVVKAHGGRVVLVNLVEGRSTTRMIARQQLPIDKTNPTDSTRVFQDEPNGPAAPFAKRTQRPRMVASSSTKAGSKLVSPSCASPISGVAIDWCAPPSGASVTPGRGGDKDETGILVAGVVQGIEPALDERDRRACRPACRRSPKIECDRPSAESMMNRFISAMPSSRCWPLRREAPS